MPKQLQTALEARRWMVANPWKELEDIEGDRWRWNPDECWLEYRSAHGSVFMPSTCVYIKPPFTVIDEPIVRDFRTPQTDPQEGTLYNAEWAGSKPVSPLVQEALTNLGYKNYDEYIKALKAAKKQPEWVRVVFTDEETLVTRAGDGSLWEGFEDYYEALKHIRKHAQQAQITYPDWSVAAQGGHHYDMEDLDFNEEMKLLYALQIGAVVEYLPKEGE